MGSGTVYREVPARAALNRVHGMPFEWSLNPYRGCEHACTYCFSREYHHRMGRDPQRGFDSEIEVKINFSELLAHELARGRTGTIALGTGTDPYQQCEGRYRLTQRSLEALCAWPLPLIVITKGTLIVRDAAVLGRLARLTDVRVLFSIGTTDPGIARALEPGAPPPGKRLLAMRRLREAGVKAGVICAPIVPGLSDTEASIEAVARAAAEHDAYLFTSRVLKLDPGVRPGYLAFIAEAFPALYPRYLERYAAGPMLDKGYARVIERRVERVRSRHPFPADTERDADPHRAPQPQLRLAI